MTRILGSKRTFTDIGDEETIEFVQMVSDIIALDEYQKLKQYTHHFTTTRYQHCLNVAWYTYQWCKKAGLNCRSAVRGAMLHDFFLYDHRRGGQPVPGRHSEIHPMAALANARRYFEVDDIMYDCIANHMFPSSSVPPQTKEGMIVSLADKYCASMELGSGPVNRVLPVLSSAYRMMTQ